MRCAAWSVLFNFPLEEILLKQIIEIFWAVLPDCFFYLARIWSAIALPTSYANATKVLASFEKFVKSRFLVIGKSAFHFCISFVLKEEIIFLLFRDIETLF